MKGTRGMYYKCLLFMGLMLTMGCQAPLPDPPELAHRVDVVDVLHGVEVHDPYRWLEEEDSEETIAFLEEQGAYTQAYLDTLPQRDKLKKQIEKYYSLTRISRPGVYKNRYLVSVHEGLKNHSQYFYNDGSYDAPRKLFLDPNTWSEDGTTALDWMKYTHDAKMVAYGVSESGDEWSTLHIKNLDTGEVLPDRIPRCRYCSIVWDADKKGFLYTRYPMPGEVAEGDENYNRKAYYHKIGDDWKNDKLVIGDLVQKEENISFGLASDLEHVTLSRTVDWAKNDLYIAKRGSYDFKPVVVGQDGRTGADVYDGKIFIHTCIDAPRFRVAVADIDKPQQKYWKEIIPQQKGVIENIAIIGGKLFVHISEDVHSRLFEYDFEGNPVKEIKLPTLGTMGSMSGEADGDEMFFSFSSFAYPNANFRYDLKTGELEEIWRLDINFDPSKYVTDQIWFKSKDGTKVPMFVVHRKDIKLDGTNPTVLYGYGGFNINEEPRFSTSILPWLNGGGVYVVANLRGGGEFGKAWHEAGRRAVKQNTFDDFIAASETLIKKGYTSPDHLGIYGGSNGGLLVGACQVQRPELYKAVVCAVPLLDMVRYTGFAIARLWIPEYGDPENEEQFGWLYAYSPYHHVEKGVKYPATMLKTGASDSRVQPMHAFKMAAMLQWANGGDNPIFLRVESKAGHGAGKPLTKRIEETADVWAFFMDQLGMK